MTNNPYQSHDLFKKWLFWSVYVRLYRKKIVFVLFIQPTGCLNCFSGLLISVRNEGGFDWVFLVSPTMPCSSAAPSSSIIEYNKHQYL
jgi:hypothetical protein